MFGITLSIQRSSYLLGFGKLSRTLSRLHRSQFLQQSTRSKALDEIYQIYMSLHRSDLTISAKLMYSPHHFAVRSDSLTRSDSSTKIWSSSELDPSQPRAWARSRGRCSASAARAPPRARRLRGAGGSPARPPASPRTTKPLNADRFLCCDEFFSSP